MHQPTLYIVAIHFALKEDNLSIMDKEPSHVSVIQFANLPSSCYFNIFPSPPSTQLDNELFEQLATDVYDEVDRRETDASQSTHTYL